MEERKIDLEGSKRRRKEEKWRGNRGGREEEGLGGRVEENRGRRMRGEKRTEHKHRGDISIQQ